MIDVANYACCPDCQSKASMNDKLCEILGVSTAASLDEIHAAFRKKAREHHPDLGGDRQKFQQLNAAYEELIRQKEAVRSSGTSQLQPQSETSTPAANPYQSPPMRKRKKTAESPKSEFQRSAKYLLTGKLPLQDQTTYFILVNALDIFLTYLHLRSGNIESNPLANFFFKNWNIIGMVAFKMTIVASVCVIAQIVALKSLQKGSRLLNFGTAFIGCVVLYSIWLLVKHSGT